MNVLFDEKQIAHRVEELSSDIIHDYQGKEMTVLGVMTGSLIFIADLIRHIPLKMKLEVVSAKSYGNTCKSTGMPELYGLDIKELKDRHVLIIDDILDTGKTLSKIIDSVNKCSPASLKTCVLLRKKAKRQVEVDVDYVGFEVDNLFVVGYGLDYAGEHRQYPYIASLK